MHHHRDMVSRSLFYWSSLFSKQLKEGESYRKLEPTYAINFLNYTDFPSDDPLNYYRLTDLRTGHTLTDLIGLYFVELPKFHSGHQRLSEHLIDWLTFFEAEDDTVREQLAAKNPAIKKAEDTLKYISHDEKERLLYADRYKAIIDYESNIQSSHEDGILLGETKVAKALLAKGQSVAYVAEVTDFSVAQVEQIKRSMNSHH